MAIHWETLLASALMSLLVTLAIEYFAKPRLEARKEEILEAHRSRREVLAATIRIIYAADVVSTEIPGDAEPVVRGNVYVEQDRQYERLQNEIQRLADDVGRHAGTHLERFLHLIVGYASTLQGLLMSARPRPEQAAIIKDAAASMAIVLSPPRPWQIWKALAYQRAVTEAERLITSHTASLS